ncbi:synaptobrevin-domain-containing protein [Gongronella butleri]|nr:synaptobrevin-domain-containing protein [Gongronella butleri]
MSTPYDPYVPNSPQQPGGSKTAHVQQQVDDVVNIMQQNIDKAMNRGERLDDLQNKTEDLNATSSQFRRGANQVRKRMWWKDCKWKIIIALTVIIILAVIIGSIAGTQANKNDNSSSSSSSQPQASPTESAAVTGSAT